MSTQLEKIKKLIEQELQPAPEVRKPNPQNVAPWINQAETSRNRLASIDAEIARLKQQILNLKRQIQMKQEEKRKINNGY